NALTPLVTYTYLPDDPSKSLDQTAGITVAQRFHFMVDNQAAQAATLLKANDAVKPVVIFPPINSIGGGLQIVTPPEASSCPAAPFIPPPMYDPTCHEQSWVGVAGPGQAGTVDDFHQTSDPFVLMPGLGVRPTGHGYVPTLAVGGCPACLHIHWRWP